MAQLAFNEMKRMLDKHSIRFEPYVELKSKSPIMALDKKIYPAIIKAYSKKIIHKAKEGFAETGILSSKELETAYNRLANRIKKKKLKNTVILVQKEIKGMEFIIGGKYDETFGYVIIFGLGGVYAEILNKVAMRICPVTEEMGNEMVEEIAGKFPLKGSTKKALAKIIVKLSKLIEKEKIIESDLNPVIINKNGAHIVDARMIK